MLVERKQGETGKNKLIKGERNAVCTTHTAPSPAPGEAAGSVRGV